MTEFFDAVYIAISGNISFLEAMTLLLLAGVPYLLSKKYKIASVIYSVFLILYITLFRREQGYNEIIRLNIRLKNAGVMVGNLLNLLLYIPFGGSMAVWKAQQRKSIWLVAAGTSFLLSVFCESMQYLSGRGWADLNDVVFNTVGGIVGVWLMKNISTDFRD